MKMPESLRNLWWDRALERSWFKDGYESAVERIEDFTDGPENSYWHGPTAETDAFPDEHDLYGEMGAYFSVEKARQAAFELLVLADLAESGTGDGLGR